jgi:hypothetical protein
MKRFSFINRFGKFSIFNFQFSILLFLSTACTGDFDRMNTDPAAIEADPKYIPYMFTYAENEMIWNLSRYQTCQNLYADLYSQYYALTTTSFETDRYVMRTAWLQRQWEATYIDVVPQLSSIFAVSAPDSPEYALADILWVWMFHRLTDGFGPIPYFGAGEQETVPYAGVEQIYNDFFMRLTRAADNLRNHPDATPFKGFDILYNGDGGKWMRFANTLRLRLAMRISNVTPARAKAEAEAAVAAGVFIDNTDCAMLQKSPTSLAKYRNGLAQVAYYNEFAMSSTIASYLKGYSDPRMGQYFQPALETNTFNSLRNGLPAVKQSLDRNTAKYNSNVGTYWVTPNMQSKTFSPNLGVSQPVISCAEAYFLRAEGALNNWNMNGFAKDLYEEGIRKSLAQWGATAAQTDAYLTSGATPAAPDDSENSPAVSDTPVEWSAVPAVQRKQTGTQKWLALWPDGHEGWAEFRRTGYPDMYPVVVNMNADIPQGEWIKRLPYPDSEIKDNIIELEKGRQLLGGADNCNTRLWWNVE